MARAIHQEDEETETRFLFLLSYKLFLIISYNPVAPTPKLMMNFNVINYAHVVGMNVKWTRYYGKQTTKPRHHDVNYYMHKTAG